MALSYQQNVIRIIRREPNNVKRVHECGCPTAEHCLELYFTHNIAEFHSAKSDSCYLQIICI